ncbi:hypothetical protein Tco_1449371 [Tanacetum coccineum]
MKAKLLLLEASPTTTQSPKPFQSKNKGLVAETCDWDEEEVSDDEEMTPVKVLMALAIDELAVGKNHACNGEWIDITIRKITEESSKNDVKENPFIPDSMDNDHEMIPKSKDWVERFNPDSKLPNFNTERILTPESQTVNEHLKLTEACTDPKSSKESGSEPLTPITSLKKSSRSFSKL